MFKTGREHIVNAIYYLMCFLKMYFSLCIRKANALIENKLRLADDFLIISENTNVTKSIIDDLKGK